MVNTMKRLTLIRALDRVSWPCLRQFFATFVNTPAFGTWSITLNIFVSSISFASWNKLTAINQALLSIPLACCKSVIFIRDKVTTGRINLSEGNKDIIAYFCRCNKQTDPLACMRFYLYHCILVTGSLHLTDIENHTAHASVHFIIRWQEYLNILLIKPCPINICTNLDLCNWAFLDQCLLQCQEYVCHSCSHNNKQSHGIGRLQSFHLVYSVEWKLQVVDWLRNQLADSHSW